MCVYSVFGVHVYVCPSVSCVSCVVLHKTIEINYNTVTVLLKGPFLSTTIDKNPYQTCEIKSQRERMIKGEREERRQVYVCILEREKKVSLASRSELVTDRR